MNHGVYIFYKARKHNRVLGILSSNLDPNWKHFFFYHVAWLPIGNQIYTDSEINVKVWTFLNVLNNLMMRATWALTDKTMEVLSSQINTIVTFNRNPHSKNIRLFYCINFLKFIIFIFLQVHCRMINVFSLKTNRNKKEGKKKTRCFDILHSKWLKSTTLKKNYNVSDLFSW